MNDITGLIGQLALRARLQREGMQTLDSDTSSIMQIAQLNEQKRNRESIRAAAQERHDAADAARIYAVLEKTKQMRAEAAGFDAPDETAVPPDYRDYSPHFISGQEGRRRQSKEMEAAKDKEDDQKAEAIAWERLQNWPKDKPMTADSIRSMGLTPKVTKSALQQAGFERTLERDEAKDAAKEAEAEDFKGLDAAADLPALEAYKPTTVAGSKEHQKRIGARKTEIERAVDNARADRALAMTADAKTAATGWKEFRAAIRDTQKKFTTGSIFGGDRKFDEVAWSMANPELAVKWRKGIIAAGKAGVALSQEAIDTDEDVAPAAGGNEVDTLLPLIESGKATPEQKARFLELTRTTTK